MLAAFGMAEFPYVKDYGFETIMNELIALLGVERVLTAPKDLIPCSFDGTAALRQRPRCAVFPQTVDEVAAVLRVATAQRVPIVTHGFRHGLERGESACA
ncbi:MAG: glycolate oxidase subunit GlcD [Pedosphaera sp.]|nr:glycolate oxidase subunit GlcD [Pedosphaera sp.]